MSSEENAEVTRRWYTEGWTGHFDIAEEIFAPDLAVNGQVVGPAVRGTAAPIGSSASPMCR